MDAQKRQKSLSEKKRRAAVHNVPTDIHLGERHAPLASLNLLFATNTKRYAPGFIVPYQGLVAPIGTWGFPGGFQPHFHTNPLINIYK
ncbi:hypothetical protein, partial [Herbaspirillum sp.]|uniref:hypothetical protein n=1 Tax=Herbaspirillum sp. TaxID=1890675 RepID=UPI0025881B4E